METPTVAGFSQERVNVKRPRVDFSSPPARDPTIERELDLVKSDASIPSHVKSLLIHLMDTKDSMQWMIEQYRELKAEVLLLREENKFLKTLVHS